MGHRGLPRRITTWKFGDLPEDFLRHLQANNKTNLSIDELIREFKEWRNTKEA